MGGGVAGRPHAGAVDGGDLLPWIDILSGGMAYTTRADFLERARSRLAPLDHVFPANGASDFDLNPHWKPVPEARPRAAAVLMGLQERDDDFGVLLTLRPETMAQHPGQVAFPGGRVDLADASPLAAALREAHEEVGVDSGDLELLGQGDPYLTTTNYLVSLFVAVLPPDFVPRPEPYEVADVFETPLSFLMNPDNHERHEAVRNGVLRAWYAMPHNGRYIWGATAGMIRSLYLRLYTEPDGP
ncbi:MAG: CoA pyrophosphatase [Hyphomonadaceae bacterium]